MLKSDIWRALIYINEKVYCIGAIFASCVAPTSAI